MKYLKFLFPKKGIDKIANKNPLVKRHNEIVMDILNIIILSFIQGVTEFLPISSSSHLVLLAELSDYPDQGLDLI